MSSIKQILEQSKSANDVDRDFEEEKIYSQLDIIKKVCGGIMGKSMLERNRKRDNVFKRCVYFKCCKEITNASYSEIGRSMGYNHATVMHCLNLFELDIASGNFPLFFEYYEMCISESTKAINNGFKELTLKSIAMNHILINQRKYIESLEKILNKIPMSIKVKYA